MEYRPREIRAIIEAEHDWFQEQFPWIFLWGFVVGFALAKL